MAEINPNDKKEELQVSFVAESAESTIEKPETKNEKTKKRGKAKSEDENEVKLDTILKAAREMKNTDLRSLQKGVAKPLFESARDKEKKCFAIGGVLTDIINNLKGQTYALAGTGFNLDGTPITRVKGRNWEELYTELLTYLATAEALGCTYQGRFGQLLDKKSQTEASKALLDDLSTDLKKMTLTASSLGPRHDKELADIDTKVKNIALRVQLANLSWDYEKMDRVEELEKRYAELPQESKQKLNELLVRVGKLRAESDKAKIINGRGDVIQNERDAEGNTVAIRYLSFTPEERSLFFHPPDETTLARRNALKAIREKELSAMDDKIDQRKRILATSVPSPFSLRKSADKVVAGINDVSEEVFGNLAQEKTAMRSLLAQAMNIYSDERRMAVEEGGEMETIIGGEKESFAKILEILGRLRLAREASEEETIKAVVEAKIADKVLAENRQRDVFERMALDMSEMAHSDKVRDMTKSFMAQLIDEYQKAEEAQTDEEKAEASERLQQMESDFSEVVTKIESGPETTTPIEELIQTGPTPKVDIEPSLIPEAPHEVPSKKPSEKPSETGFKQPIFRRKG